MMRPYFLFCGTLFLFTTAKADEDCGLGSFLGQCTSTSQCQTIYDSADDCSLSDGGVCLCNGEACGCLFSAVPSSAPTVCGLEQYQSECTTTSQCQGMYADATDCSNAKGGVCLCDDMVCGCDKSNAPSTTPSSAPTECGPQQFLNECTTTSQCQGMYAAADDCLNSSGGVCMCAGKTCGCYHRSQVPSSAPTTCGPQHFQSECTNTRQCQEKYAGAKDCWNAAGGVCLCGGMDVCGCL